MYFVFEYKCSARVQIFGQGYLDMGLEARYMVDMFSKHCLQTTLLEFMIDD